MGLLEKAEKIQTDTPDNEPAKVVPEPVSQPEPLLRNQRRRRSHLDVAERRRQRRQRRNEFQE